MENVSYGLSLFFGLTTLLSIHLFARASGQRLLLRLILLLWILLISALTYLGFPQQTNTFPPRLMLMVLPTLITILLLFITPSGRKWMDSLNTTRLHWVHVVRIPVELCLYGLFIAKLVPEMMTFAGRNFDILAGITAPLAIYFYTQNSLSKIGLLIWNFLSLILLLNIVTTAVLSAPFPFQQFGFEQPNVAVLMFPFVWLPTCVVPLVLASHLICIRALLKK